MIPCVSTGIHSECCGKKGYFSVLQSMEACREAGFSAVDINLNDACLPGGGLDDDTTWRSWLSKVRDKADELGLCLKYAHSSFYVREDRTQRAEELTSRSVEAAGILKIPYIVVHPYSVRDDAWYSYHLSLKENIEYMFSYAEISSKYGTCIAIENMVEGKDCRRFGSSAEDLMDLLECLNDPVFSVCWDFGHGERSGCDTCGSLRIIGPDLSVVHVHDWTLNQVGYDHTIPFLGRTDWSSAMQVLKEIGFNGELNLECPNFTKNLPEKLRPQALKLAYEAAERLICLS